MVPVQKWRDNLEELSTSPHRTYPLVIQQFAIEKRPCVVDLPIKHGDFPYLCNRFAFKMVITRGWLLIVILPYFTHQKRWFSIIYIDFPIKNGDFFHSKLFVHRGGSPALAAAAASRALRSSSAPEARGSSRPATVRRGWFWGPQQGGLSYWYIIHYIYIYMGISWNGDIPKWMVYFMENPTKNI